MWVFYYDVPQVSIMNSFSDVTIFIVLGIITSAIIMTPSFFEKTRK